MPGPHGERTILDALVFLTRHGAYHLGSLGVERLAIGYPGPAELVMAAMAGSNGPSGERSG